MAWRHDDLVWLAGFIDGEGSIGINRVRSLSAHIDGSFVAHFNVGGTDEEAIRWVAQTFNGEFKTTPNTNPLKPHYKDAHRCRWNYETGPEVLKAVLPYLKIKRLQAVYYIEYCCECSSILYGRSLPPRVRKRAARLAVLCAEVSDHQTRWKGIGI